MRDLEPHMTETFRSWSCSFNPNADVMAYLEKHLNVTSACIFMSIIIPKFIEVQGCVILQRNYDPETFKQWWESENKNTLTIEAAINRMHLWDIFDQDDPEEQQLESLAETIAYTWELHAQRQFPERKFEAKVTDDYGPTVVLTSLHTKT